MAVKVIIPTPLRAYAGKQESVEVQAATVGEALAALTSKFGGAEEAPLFRRRPDAQLRERLRERRRHSLPAEGKDGREGGRHDQHRAVDCRRRAKAAAS